MTGAGERWKGAPPFLRAMYRLAVITFVATVYLVGVILAVVLVVSTLYF